MTQKTGYPWNGDVRLTFNTRKRFRKEVRVRIPSWCEGWKLSVNGREVKPVLDKGYAVLKRAWRNGDTIALVLDEPVRMVQADPRVKQDVGKRAVQRGPLVYCIEETDNKTGFVGLELSSGTRFAGDSAIFSVSVLLPSRPSVYCLPPAT